MTEVLQLAAPATAKKERRLNDAYFTPPKPVRIILHELRDEIALLDGPIVEPSAGDGAFVRQLVDFCGVAPARILAIDIDKRSLAKCKKATGVRTHHGSFLDYHPRERPSLVMGNPPYHMDLPEAFVRHVLSWRFKKADRPWMMVLLLRLNWLGSQGRAPLHRAHPADIYILPERTSFTADGGTDMTEYAFFVWRSWRRGGSYYHLPVHDPAQGLLDFGE